MQELISLICKYDKEKHLKYVSKNEDFSNYKLEKLNSKIWKKDNSLIPYNIVTYLLDSYYCFPERVDMSFLYLWQCINNIYNELQYLDSTINKSTDSRGIDKFIDMLETEFDKTITYNGKTTTLEEIFFNYVSKCPLKLYSFISNYLLKNYVIEKKFSSIAPKVLSSSYITFSKKNKVLYDSIIETYGKAYEEICNPQIGVNNTIELKIADNNKSREITHSLAESLKKLINNGTVKINRNSPDVFLKVTKREKIEFIFRDMVYAVRCNSFHGNIASRLNSIHANKHSLIASKFIFYISHFFINVGLLNLGKMNLDEIDISIKNYENNFL